MMKAVQYLCGLKTDGPSAAHRNTQMGIATGWQVTNTAPYRFSPALRLAGIEQDSAL